MWAKIVWGVPKDCFRVAYCGSASTKRRVMGVTARSDLADDTPEVK
jgi:hypothetical protein